MQLETLKTKTFDLWQELNKLERVYFEPWAEAAFLDEVKRYGDLAEFDTWRKAYAAIRAKFLVVGCLDEPQFLIEFYLIYGSCKWEWRELLPDVVAQLCLYPEGKQAIADGLEDIRTYGCAYGATTADLAQFKELLIEQQQRVEQKAIRQGNAA